MRKDDPRRSQRGVSLVESLVALVLLALGIAAIGGFMTTQIRHSADNELTAQAYSIAADEVERIRALPYSQMDAASSTVAHGSVDFAVSSSVVDNAPAINMKSVNVNVAWTSPSGAHDIDVDTVFTQVAPE